MIINYFMNIILVGKKMLHLTGCHTSIGHKCIKYKGCKLWNNLPLDLKSITSNKLFNNKLKFSYVAHLIN